VQVGREHGDEIDREHGSRKAPRAGNEQSDRTSDLGCAGEQHKLEVKRNPWGHHGEVATRGKPVVATDKQQGSRHGKSHPRGPVAHERDGRQGEENEQGEEEHSLDLSGL
jgi:hypothetical protein